jgi:hypothetical protein
VWDWEGGRGRRDRGSGGGLRMERREIECSRQASIGLFWIKKYQLLFCRDVRRNSLCHALYFVMCLYVNWMEILYIQELRLKNKARKVE